MIKPNFFIIGAPKCGTTSLYYYLNQHPEIYLSEKKEPHYFAYKYYSFGGPGDNSLAEDSMVLENLNYYDLFVGIAEKKPYAKVFGEASACYLFGAAGAITRMDHELGYGNFKCVAILRNPVERAYSNWLHLVRDGKEKYDFEDGLAAEKLRHKDNYLPVWFYTQTGYYAKQLKSYYNVIGKENIKVYLFEDLKNDPYFVLFSICNFLGVKCGFDFDVSLKYNQTGIHKTKVHSLLYNMLITKYWWKKYFHNVSLNQSLQRKIMKSSKRPQMKEETRDMLKKKFKSDILQLQDLINRDLGEWL